MANWGSCNFNEFKELQQKIQRLQTSEFDAFCRAAAKELAARLLAKVIKRTPVGETAYTDVLDDQGNPVTYKRGAKKGQAKQQVEHNGGTLRRGWTARTEAEAEQGGKTNAAEYAQSLPITKIGNVYQIEIINPVHYASYVEFGHRQTPGRFVPVLGKRLKQGWVKGRFMLTISEQELQAQAPTLLEKKLDNFLKGVL